MNYIGEDGPDILVGSDANDLLVGNGGQDTLSGGAAQDIIYGDGTDGGSAGGDDVLNGDAGNDFLVGGAGIDRLNGGDGNDILVPGLASRVTLSGGSYSFAFGGGASVTSGDGYDLGSSTGHVLDGGAGSDLAYLSFVDQPGVTFDNSGPSRANGVFAGATSVATVTAVERIVFFGSEGADLVRANDFADVLSGGGGADELYGNGGDDELYGDRGSIDPAGRSGNDALNGGAGNDLLNGGLGDDLLDGGEGSDTVKYDNAARVDLRSLDQAQNTGTAGVDILRSIENLTGSRFADSFSGDDQANRLEDDEGGNDVFNGRGGNDVIALSRSTNRFTNAAGVSQFSTAASLVELNGGDGNDTILFEGRTRYIDRASLMSGGAGDDVITAIGMRAATIDGGEGNDRITVDGRGSEDGGYRITLGAGSDTLGLRYLTASTETLSAGIVVTDFLAGIDGDVVDIGSLLTSNLFLVGPGAGNPFLSGHLRLTQTDAGTLLEVDRDGGGNEFITLLTMAGVTTSSLAAFNLSFVTGLGTPGADTLGGTAGFDRLLGQAGDDQLDGGAGSDLLDGGDGADRLRGGDGDDYLIGGGGIDTALFAGFFGKAAVAIGTGSITVTTAGGADRAVGVERFQFADGAFVVDADSSGAQIMRLYDTILDRAPDPLGLEIYVDRIERGQSLASVAGEFVASAEFQAATGSLSNAQFVDYVYRQALGRAPDAGGAAFYAQRLDQGLSRGAFTVELSESAEHRGLTAAMAANGYFDTDSRYQSVALLYDSFLGRLPDEGGITFYAEQLKAGTLSVSQVAADFAGSAEFRAATQGKSNAELVDYVYRNTLDRAPDPGGAAFYTDRLNQGFGVADFVAEVGLSQEHYNLMSGAIIGGIDLI